MLMQMADWEKQFGVGVGNGKSAVENSPSNLQGPDSGKAVDTARP
jgi:hypothetical protein